MSTTVGIAHFKENSEHEKTVFATDQEARQWLQRYFMNLNGPELEAFTTRGNEAARTKGLTYTGLDIKQAKDCQELAPEHSDGQHWFITLEAE